MPRTRRGATVLRLWCVAGLGTRYGASPASENAWEQQMASQNTSMAGGVSKGPGEGQRSVHKLMTLLASDPRRDRLAFAGQGDIRIFTPNGAGNKDLAEVSGVRPGCSCTPSADQQFCTPSTLCLPVQCLKHAIQVRKDILRDSGLGQELKHVALVVDANNVLVPRWSGQGKRPRFVCAHGGKADARKQYLFDFPLRSTELRRVFLRH